MSNRRGSWSLLGFRALGAKHARGKRNSKRQAHENDRAFLLFLRGRRRYYGILVHELDVEIEKVTKRLPRSYTR